jgi:hypothetical protein
MVINANYNFLQKFRIVERLSNAVDVFENHFDTDIYGYIAKYYLAK